MGCDIHPHFEIKVDGKWEHYSNPRIERWYELFAKICGVRNDYNNHIEPISDPKGLPSDVSKIVKLCSDYEGGHSHTWLDKHEIIELIDWVGNNHGSDFWELEWEHKQLGYLFGNGWSNWVEYPMDYPDFIQDIRFICWFDS